ncbi:Hypothetical protein, putative [Bodo saltans]|uniref:Uncharacterized protein n=1 Tax=Bodo saltans TaxID=75058 RepID=A0A0S4IXR7_BODSA|nr:Hypothetical protein, putative [Bodo saltans]|eukprot:CUG46084.1 Hypothetical protein, putative [Bodo saltans]
MTPTTAEHQQAPSSAADIEIFTAEALAWVDLSNRVAADTQRAILVTTIEPQSRSEVVMEMIAERFALAGKYAIIIQGVVAEARMSLTEVQREVAQQRAELAALPARLDAKEKALMSELHTRYDLKVAELEEGGNRLQDTRSKLQAEVVDLSRRRDEELSALPSQISATNQMNDESAYTTKRSQPQKRELEVQLELLRSKVVSEKTLLDTLTEEEAVKRKKLEVLTEMGAVQPRHHHSSTPRGTLGGNNDGSVASQPSDSPPRGGDQLVVSSKLDFGISTLQSVRDQLREIREGSLSPIRRSNSQSLGTPQQQPSTATSSSYATAPLDARGGNEDLPLRTAQSSVTNRQQASLSLYGSSSSSSSPAFSSPTVNPWKERLRQLQGDLQSLRADLGAK